MVDIKDNKKVIHLSHIDSDGYSAQYLTNFILKDVEYLNINYNDNMLDILYKARYIQDKPILIISDVSMMNHEMIYFLKELGGGFERIYYIDHHQDEITVKDKKLTVFHDKTVSSTEIVYDNFIKNNRFISNITKDKLSLLAYYITIYDLNKISHPDFYKSTVINDACMAEWCNPFDYKDNRNPKYRFLEIDIALNSILENETFLMFTRKIDKSRLAYIKNNNNFKNEKIYDIYDGLSLINPLYTSSINRMLFIECIQAEETFLKASSSVKQKYLRNIVYNVNMKNRNRRDVFLDLHKVEFENNINFLRLLQKMNVSEVTPDNGVVVLNKEKQMLFHSIAPLILENKDIIVLCNILDNNRISIRTQSDIKANILAKEVFNGGGHINEAGGSYSGETKDIKINIQKYIKTRINNEK